MILNWLIMKRPVRYISERFDADPLYKVRVYQGLQRQLLAELRKKGVLLAVCSNKPHDAAIKVVKALFGDEFDFVDRAKRGNKEKACTRCSVKGG